MPIYLDAGENSESIVVQFGHGDIAIGEIVPKQASSRHGGVHFVQIEPIKIGDNISINSADFGPVILVFNRPESIDVLTEQLAAVKARMLAPVTP